MVQDEEEFPANTEVFKGESDEVLRHWARNSDEKRFNQCFPRPTPALRALPLPEEVGKKRKIYFRFAVIEVPRLARSRRRTFSGSLRFCTIFFTASVDSLWSASVLMTPKVVK